MGHTDSDFLGSISSRIPVSSYKISLDALCRSNNEFDSNIVNINDNFESSKSSNYDSPSNSSKKY